MSMESAMNKQDVVSIVSYVLDEQQKNSIPNHLSQSLYHFIAHSYHIKSQEECNQLIIQPRKEGELNVLLGLNEEIAGFCRTFKQTIPLGKKIITAYTAYLFLNPDYNVYPSMENTGLLQAMKYKLDHPEEELVYIAFANNPLIFKFIYQLSKILYPKPNQRIPEQIVSIISALKKENKWISTNTHPMVINSSLIPLGSQTTTFYDEHSELHEFYLNTNPDYIEGNTLLVYLPLHLANIGHGFNHLHTTNDNDMIAPHYFERHSGRNDLQV